MWCLFFSDMDFNKWSVIWIFRQASYAHSWAAKAKSCGLHWDCHWMAGGTAMDDATIDFWEFGVGMGAIMWLKA